MYYRLFVAERSGCVSFEFATKINNCIAEYILRAYMDIFSFFYLRCFSTIVDKFMWLEYIARYP